MGIATKVPGQYDEPGTGGAAWMIQQDGLSAYPWQEGIYGTNMNATSIGENGKQVFNYANCSDNDGFGLSYNAGMADPMERGLAILAANRDPFSGLPVNVRMDGMTFLVAPRSEPQLKRILENYAMWAIANGGFNPGINSMPNVGNAQQSTFNYIKSLGIKIKTSQVWVNRLVDVGLLKISTAGAATAQVFTNAATDAFNTANSIASFGMFGHFKDAIKYHMLQPYKVEAIPLSSVEYGSQIVSIQDIREEGSPYWHNPRESYRFFA